MFTPLHRLQCLISEAKGRDLSRTGAWRQELKQRLLRDTGYLLAPYDSFSLLSYTPWYHLSRLAQPVDQFISIIN